MKFRAFYNRKAHLLREIFLNSNMILCGETYIMTNKNNTTLYTGSTSDLQARVIQHREKIYPRAFTARYNCAKLVFWRSFQSIEEALNFEYYIRGKSRKWKIDLIEADNPTWRDLYEDIASW
jgi:putative endonuclease